MAILKIKTGLVRGAVFALKPGSNRIGRGEGNDYRLPDASISPIHCEIVLDGTGKLFVRDLDSLSGTFVDGERVELAVLLGGETLRLGDVDLIYDKRWWNDYSASSAEIPAPAPDREVEEATLLQKCLAESNH